MDQSSKAGVSDLTNLGQLHEGSIYYNLHLRFKEDLPYTYACAGREIARCTKLKTVSSYDHRYCGNILVAMNPFKKLKIYDDDSIKEYAGKKLGSLPPHVFAMANSAYDGMRTSHKSQCVVIR